MLKFRLSLLRATYVFRTDGTASPHSMIAQATAATGDTQRAVSTGWKRSRFCSKAGTVKNASLPSYVYVRAILRCRHILLNLGFFQRSATVAVYTPERAGMPGSAVCDHVVALTSGYLRNVEPTSCHNSYNHIPQSWQAAALWSTGSAAASYTASSSLTPLSFVPFHFDGTDMGTTEPNG